jgi:hypothetical protein
MLRFKPEVRIGYFNEHLCDILRNAALWSLKERIDVHISSIHDSAAHMATSLHYYDLAVDLNPDTMSSSDRSRLVDWLRRYLPDSEFDIVLENTHIHVEYDIRSKAGRTDT